MFNSGIKGNQRCNGISSTPLEHFNNSNRSKDQHNNVKSTENLYHKNTIQSLSDTEVKVEVDDHDIENRITVHSIIGLNDDKPHKQSGNIKPPRLKFIDIKSTKTSHETLQRIEPQDYCNHYQKYWFSGSIEKFKLENRSREERIEITRHEFLRHLQQIIRSNVGKPNKDIKFELHIKKSHRKKSSNNCLVPTRICEIDNCNQIALPCTRHCKLHIMYNKDQVLFGYCTAKFADNTQCSIPVFDITHELPLCPEHARKRDNYKLYQEAKPKKIRKKVKPSAMIRPQKRSKKRKKQIKSTIESNSAIINLPIPSEIDEVKEETPELEEDIHIVDQVLGLNESDALEQVLETQASNLLEEPDISTVLSTIQVDEFSDFFTVNRNGEYEPSREETEELEKALAAVDNDVKSLEKLSQSQGLLDSLLDEHTLADSLVQIPDVFHNGYTPCGDNMVTQTSSFLLPVIEPQSHS